MPDIKLKVIPEPAPNTRPVMKAIPPASNDPSFMFFKFGEGGDVALVCGGPGCFRKLAAGLKSSTQIQDVVFCCPSCGAFNDTGLSTN